MDSVEGVKAFLRGQNLEQVGRIDEAIEHYEDVIAAGFDSTGPYDRLIALYSERALHAEVIRVADVALANVHTYEDKKDWYRRMKEGAEKARVDVPKAAPRRAASSDRLDDPKAAPRPAASSDRLDDRENTN